MTGGLMRKAFAAKPTDLLGGEQRRRSAVPASVCVLEYRKPRAARDEQ